LAHKNPYDFTQVHRHTYYELLLFEKGLGTQLIDFKTFELKDYSAYLVFPDQAHLLKRDSTLEWLDCTVSRTRRFIE
jgi:AraC family transcriptional activator of pobA